MKINKLMNTLLVFLILIICVGAVSANEDASTDSIPTEDAQSLAIVQDSPLNSDVQPLDSSPDLTLNEIDNTQISDSDKNQNDESKGALGTDSTADGQYVGGSDDGESDDSEPPIIVYNQGNIRYVLSGHSIVSDETYRVLGTWGPSHYHNHYIDYTFECASLPWLMNDTTWVYCIHCGSRDPDGADFLPGSRLRLQEGDSAESQGPVPDLRRNRGEARDITGDLFEVRRIRPGGIYTAVPLRYDAERDNLSGL